MGTKRLIVNADGYGFTFGNNRAIRDTLRAGIVTSVSVNANFPAADEVGELEQDFPGVSVGIHFNLAVGRPVSEPASIPSLVRPDGTFLDQAFLPALVRGRVRARDVQRELEAQVGALVVRGARLSHWDGHRNQHLLPIYFDVAMRVARAAGIERMRTNRHWLFAAGGTLSPLRAYARNPARLARHAATALWMARGRLGGFRMADRMITPLRGGPGTWKTDRAMWSQLFRALPAGTSEIYCHPGYVDETLREYARYADEREVEARTLADPGLREEAERAGVELISFWEI